MEIAFDDPVRDGKFWVDESKGFILIIDKEEESQLENCLIDYKDGRFVAVRGR